MQGLYTCIEKRSTKRKTVVHCCITVSGYVKYQKDEFMREQDIERLLDLGKLITANFIVGKTFGNDY